MTEWVKASNTAQTQAVNTAINIKEEDDPYCKQQNHGNIKKRKNGRKDANHFSDANRSSIDRARKEHQRHLEEIK